MELLTLKITPLSNFVTYPKGEIIFGHILSYLFLKKDNSFKNYLEEEPKLIVSDMMPFGYVYRPILPTEYFKKDNEEIDIKKLKKSKFIKIEDLQNGFLYMYKDIKFKIDELVVKNSINRTSFTTGEDNFAPYGYSEINFTKELWMFILVDTKIKDKILETIQEIGRFGFGKEANLGKGRFSFTLFKNPKNPIKDMKSNYHMSISPTILQNIKKKYEEEVFYDTYTKFGKFGLDRSFKNAFKKPVIMADSGAVFKGTLNKKYFGSSINSGFDKKDSFLQGYSIAIPIKIKE